MNSCDVITDSFIIGLILGEYREENVKDGFVSLERYPVHVTDKKNYAKSLKKLERKGYITTDGTRIKLNTTIFFNPNFFKFKV